MSNIFNEKLYTTIDNVNAKSYNVAASYDPLFNEIIFVAKKYSHLLFEDGALNYSFNYRDYWADLQFPEICDALYLFSLYQFRKNFLLVLVPL